MFSILLAVSLVLYLMFTVLQYGIVSVRKSNALSNKTSLDGVNGGGKFSEEQIKRHKRYHEKGFFGCQFCKYKTQKKFNMTRHLEEIHNHYENSDENMSDIDPKLICKPPQLLV